MNNYDDVLAQMRAHGLLVDGLEVDSSRIKRVKVEGGGHEKRGWYRLYSFQLDGQTMISGAFGVYHGNDNGKQVIALPKDLRKRMTPEQLAAQKSQWKESQRRADAERQREADAASARALSMWKKLPASGGSEYLTRKQIKAHGVRFTPSGVLVIPMMDAADKLHGLQFVLPAGHERKKKTGRDKEFWPAGLSMQGTYHLIGGVPRSLLLIAEGYATAATLHEATGHPVAVVWSANNLLPAAQALHKRHPSARILVCADDDRMQACPSCGKWTDVDTGPACTHCGAEHRKKNAGCIAAEATAQAVNGGWLRPIFPNPPNDNRKSPNDFNDLAHEASLALVHEQVQARLAELGWLGTPSAVGATTQGGRGERLGEMVPMLSIDEGVGRFWGTYGLGGDALFDEEERRIVHKKDVLNLMPPRAWDEMRRHPDWRVARDTEIGFDPTEKDEGIRCNLFGGWPMRPKKGSCMVLLDLLMYLCSNETGSAELFDWVIKWLAYPLQHPGAKMHSAIVVHGPQGSGKSRFFEAYAKIFGEYGRVLGQEALEDKFNSDWAEKKLFILADEVLARMDMYHIKNRLKGFITGDRIRVNPKNMAAHNEKNQMNLVFLSNERQPLVLENDDRRHCVIWVPPKLSDDFFSEVNQEIENGGIPALYHHLLNLDLGDFKPWTRPPMTGAKHDLIHLGLSSEERFLKEWMNLEIEGRDGDVIPFCPCLGSHLYQVYATWCERNGEKKRAVRDLISLVSKRTGWEAGKSVATWQNLGDRTAKNRKMVVPSDGDMIAAAGQARTTAMQGVMREGFSTKAEFLTAGFYAFAMAAGIEP